MGDMPVVVELDTAAAQNDDGGDGGGGDNDDDGGYSFHYFLLGQHPSNKTREHEITYNVLMKKNLKICLYKLL